MGYACHKNKQFILRSYANCGKNTVGGVARRVQCPPYAILYDNFFIMTFFTILGQTRVPCNYSPTDKYYTYILFFSLLVFFFSRFHRNFIIVRRNNNNNNYFFLSLNVSFLPLDDNGYLFEQKI